MKRLLSRLEGLIFLPAPEQAGHSASYSADTSMSERPFVS